MFGICWEQVAQEGVSFFFWSVMRRSFHLDALRSRRIITPSRELHSHFSEEMCPRGRQSSRRSCGSSRELAITPGFLRLSQGTIESDVEWFPAWDFFLDNLWDWDYTLDY
jgi:hypothetical protein